MPFAVLGGLPVECLGPESAGRGLVYVGVGGVLTIVGPWESVRGGVLGRTEVSILGCGTREAREGGFVALGSREASEGSI